MILLVVSHPNPQSFTRAVADAVHAGIIDGGGTVEVVDLHAEAFDPVLVVNAEHLRRDLDKVPETARHRALLAKCSAVVFVYPVWWGGLPAMLKGFLDRVFVSGLAYTFASRPKNAVLPQGLMKGKSAHFFYTLDTPWLFAKLDPGWWSLYFSVLRYCGFSKIRRHYRHRLKTTTPEQRQAWLDEVRRRGRQLGAIRNTSLGV